MIEDHFNVTDSMDKIFLSKLSININDPRQNNEFLWLSYNINNIKAGQHERTYWMTLEKRCLSLFQDNGYDLQTGAWYCMIATQLYSWDGVANASWKFAECFFKEKNCWPPASANKMRAKILGWYIKQVIPVISLLPKDGQTFSSLCLLEDSLTLLSEIENTLFLKKSSFIKDFLSELRLRDKFNKEISSVIVLQSDISLLSTKDKGTVKQKKHLLLMGKLKKYTFIMCFCFLSFFIGVLFSVCISFLERPEVAWSIKQKMPESFFADLAMKYSGCYGQDTRYNYSWIQLEQKIEEFQHKLNLTEQNGRSITISELKTIAYDMYNILKKDDIPVYTRIINAYNYQHGNEKEKELQLQLIEQQLIQLKCQLGELRASSQ